MKILLDFFPVILFFVAYKVYDIYVATGVAIAASILQVAVHWLRFRKLDKMHIITLVLIVVLGGATLVLHNDVFIKWKPTAINWAFALTFLGSQFFANKPLIQTMMEKNVSLPEFVWKRLNFIWVGFFTLMGIANIIVAYHFSTDTWVNFKVFGVLGSTVVFVIIQAIYLTRHIEDEVDDKSGAC